MDFEPTPQLVKDFFQYMCNYYNVSVVSKNDSTFMSAVGTFLSTIGVQDKTKFMENYTTTIGKTVYAPFQIGTQNADGKWSLWSQITVIAHECQHVVQMSKMGVLDYNYGYLFNTATRTSLEEQAYCVSLEMHWWRYHTLESTDTYANMMAGYNVSAADVVTFKKMMDLHKLSIQSGAIIGEATQVATKWLNAHVTPQLILNLKLPPPPLPFLNLPLFKI